MLEIDGIYVDLSIIKETFVCHLPECIGNCCVEGESGAPLGQAERKALEGDLPQILPYLPIAGQQALKSLGTSYYDTDGDLVVTLVNGRECAFSYKEGRMHLCGIEKAWQEGKSRLRKPLSCHLFPIRVETFDGKPHLVYEQLKICLPGRREGRQTATPLYRFLHDALVRAYGTAWYAKLEYAAKNL